MQGRSLGSASARGSALAALHLCAVWITSLSAVDQQILGRPCGELLHVQVAVREAPCSGHSWRYSDSMMEYHYTTNPRVRPPDSLSVVIC